MKITFLVAAGLVLAGLLAYFFLARPGKTPSAALDAEIARRATRRPAPRPAVSGMYLGLRERALTIAPDSIGLTLPADEVRVYGVVMDWAMEKGIATTVAFATGDASLYTSTGGGVLGGGPHPSVAAAARQLVAKAQLYLPQAQKTAEFPLPDANSVRFYLLTNQGVYTVQENVDSFKDKSSSWLPLFEEANEVLSALRVVDAKR